MEGWRDRWMDGWMDERCVGPGFSLSSRNRILCETSRLLHLVPNIPYQPKLLDRCHSASSHDGQCHLDNAASLFA